jgi:hypothetical protein
LVTLRCWFVAVFTGGGAGSRDAVADGDLLRADEDVFDDQSQDTLAFGGVGVGGAVT